MNLERVASPNQRLEGFVMDSEGTESGETTMANLAREGLESVH